MSTDQLPQIKYPASPLNWLRMLGWILFTPAVFLGKTNDEWPNALSKTLNWLDTLLLSPLLILSFGLSVGFLPTVPDKLSVYRLILASAIMSFPMLYLVNRLYWTDGRKNYWMFTLSNGLVRGMIFGATFGIVFGIRGHVSVVMLLPLFFSVMGGITTGTVDHTVSRTKQKLGFLQLIIWLIVTSIVATGMVFIVSSGTLKLDLLELTLLYMGWFFFFSSISPQINKGILERRATIWNYIIFTFLMGAWLFLIWYSWLGGYAAL